jgi:hypothetical protein
LGDKPPGPVDSLVAFCAHSSLWLAYSRHRCPGQSSGAFVWCIRRSLQRPGPDSKEPPPLAPGLSSSSFLNVWSPSRFGIRTREALWAPRTKRT